MDILVPSNSSNKDIRSSKMDILLCTKNKNITNPERFMKPHLLQSIFPFLLSSRSHLGQRAQPLWSKKGIDPSSYFSVLGKREKLFLTNPLITLKGLLRSLRAVQTVSNYNGSILIINTNPSLSLLCERFSFFSSLNKLGFGAKQHMVRTANLNQPVGNVPLHQKQTAAIMADRQKARNETPPNKLKFSTLSFENEKSRDFSGKIFFCNEKWTGGLLSNWKKVSNSVETFDRFSKAFGPFLRENKIQFSTYKEMKKRYNGLLEFRLRKLKEESLFLGETYVQSKYLLKRNTTNSREMVVQSKAVPTSWLGKKRERVDKTRFNECESQKQESPTVPQHRTGKFNEKPDLIFLINCNENAHVLQEAASLKIPVIGITNTSTHQTGITYPIPGNSESAEFVFFCLKWVSAISTAPSVFSL